MILEKKKWYASDLQQWLKKSYHRSNSFLSQSKTKKISAYSMNWLSYLYPSRERDIIYMVIQHFQKSPLLRNVEMFKFQVEINISPWRSSFILCDFLEYLSFLPCPIHICPCISDSPLRGNFQGLIYLR